MESRALLRFSRRIAAADSRAAILEESTGALRDLFGAAVAVIVVPTAGHFEIRSTGEVADLLDPNDDLHSYSWESLRRRFPECGIVVSRAALLGDEPAASSRSLDDKSVGSNGFIAVGWSEEPQNRREDDEAALELAAEQLSLALRHTTRDAELRRTARALEEAQDQLAGTRHLCMLGEITSGVAHDFNNALTTILGTTEWLLQTMCAVYRRPLIRCRPTPEAMGPSHRSRSSMTRGRWI